MVGTEHPAATGKIDPTRSAAPPWWFRSPLNPWLAAVILALLAISHGRSQYIRWSMEEHARHEAEARRVADADGAKRLPDAAAAKRRADKKTRAAVHAEAEVPKPATPITPELERQALSAPAKSTTLAVAVMPIPPCDEAEAQVGIERGCPGRKHSFKDCPECPEMVVIPAGEVMMGSPFQEEGRASNEGPRHKVMIEKRFAASKFETTFEEWDACVLAGACKHTPNDQGWGKGRRPVINVSWEDAKEYVT